MEKHCSLKKEQYRTIEVGNEESFNIMIQVKKWYGWVTVKTIYDVEPHSEDYQHYVNETEELLSKLRERIN